MDYQPFSTKPSVEKPVENVENSCGNVGFCFRITGLCQLVLVFAGFLRADICFLCEYSEKNPLFVGNIENTPLLLGKLMISSKGWLLPDAITMPVAQLWEKAVFSTPPAPTWLQGKIF